MAMTAAINSFVTEAESRRIVPIILFLPRIRRAMLEDRDGWRPRYAGFVRALRQRYGERDLIIVDAAETDFEPEAMNVRPFDGHYSPYGNRLFARHLYDTVFRERLGPD